MDWDDDYHDESEFYYPVELENGPENVNINCERGRQYRELCTRKHSRLHHGSTPTKYGKENSVF
jgi:hypothetical protein